MNHRLSRLILLITSRLKVSLLVAAASFSLNAQNKLANPFNTVEDFINQPVLNWKIKINAPFFASPVVSSNTIYLGGLDSILHAIDLISATEKWSFRTKGEIRSDVLVTGDTLYLNGGDGELYALNKVNGNVIWQFRTGGEKKYDFADYFHSTPVIHAGTVYLGSGDGHLYAVNGKTGKLEWKYKAGNVVHTTPAIQNGRVFFGSFDGYVYALAVQTGVLVWKFKTVGHRYFPTGEVQGSPEVFGDMVFIGARDYNVYAIDQEKGYCHWNKSFYSGWGLSNNIHDSVLYIGSSDEKVLISADPKTGKEFWNMPMEFLVFGNNAWSENMLYLGTTNGKLHGISLKTGRKIWSFETDAYRKNKSRYFKEDDSYRDDIYSIIKSNEQFLEAECELGGVFSTPVISGDFLLFSTSDGTLYCLKRN